MAILFSKTSWQSISSVQQCPSWTIFKPEHNMTPCHTDNSTLKCFKLHELIVLGSYQKILYLLNTQQIIKLFSLQTHRLWSCCTDSHIAPTAVLSDKTMKRAPLDRPISQSQTLYVHTRHAACTFSVCTRFGRPDYSYTVHTHSPACRALCRLCRATREKIAKLRDKRSDERFLVWRWDERFYHKPCISSPK